jgi:hypothetical protein
MRGIVRKKREFIPNLHLGDEETNRGCWYVSLSGGKHEGSGVQIEAISHP